VTADDPRAELGGIRVEFDIGVAAVRGSDTPTNYRSVISL
jgi:hypothetical protein